MKHIKTLFTATLLSMSLGIGVLFIAPSPAVQAASPAVQEPCVNKGGLSIPNPKCDSAEYDCSGDAATCLKQNPITAWIVFFINLISVVVLVGASLMMVYAGVEYITAADNAQQVQAAKKRILNVIIGIVAYFFLFAFLQWLVPGGAF